MSTKLFNLTGKTALITGGTHGIGIGIGMAIATALSDANEIFTRTRPSNDPDSVLRRAQWLGEKHGCDLVLVLKTGPYFGRQRGYNYRIKDRGYAFNDHRLMKKKPLSAPGIQSGKGLFPDRCRTG